MRAIRLHEFGPASNLRYEEIDDPKPERKQVRIAVRAIGVHFIDTAIRAGSVTGPLAPDALPHVPGREVAGVVDAPGPDVDMNLLGARVVAHLGPRSGGYAELVIADADKVHVLPDTLPFEHAVAMIGTGRTALWVLDLARITSEDVVLITAAAGGLGSLFVQAVRAVGATSIGAAGGHDKVEHVRARGADLAVDYEEPDWTSRIGRSDVSVVLDGVGGVRGRAAFDVLDVGGRFVTFGMSSGEPVAFTSQDLIRRSLTVTAAIGPKLLRRPDGMRELETRALDEAASGRLTPVVTSFPLADAAQAHAAVESRRTIGKVVLVP